MRPAITFAARELFDLVPGIRRDERLKEYVRERLVAIDIISTIS